MGAQSAESVSALAESQMGVLSAIAGEKAGLKPYLDAWEKLAPDERARLRRGRAGEILDALEAVAKGIQARHQDWFGGDAAPAEVQKPGQAGEAPGAAAPGGEARDISQKINMYRGLA